MNTQQLVRRIGRLYREITLIERGADRANTLHESEARELMHEYNRLRKELEHMAYNA